MSSAPPDRAGRSYWDSVWTGNVPQLERLPDGRLRLPRADRRFARLFRRLGVLEHETDPRLLEIGCAGSTWLPWFAQEGFAVTGIDYSLPGCDSARWLLAATGFEGEIVCADAFEFPAELLGVFDVVVSFGVVEHFEDTAATLAAFARYLRPGGRLLTVVPNMAGVMGIAQRLANPAVYAIHLPLTADDLERAHRDAGLVFDCRYFMSVNFGIVALSGLDPRARSTRLKQAMVTGLANASKAVWLVEDRLHLPATRALAPYIVCVGSVPSGDGGA